MIYTEIENRYGTPRIVQVYKPGPKAADGRRGNSDINNSWTEDHLCSA